MMGTEVMLKLATLLECARDLCQRSHLLKVNGVHKLTKKCEAEHAFLQRLMKHSSSVKTAQLNSTNLYHLQGIVSAAERLPGVTGVLRSYKSHHLTSVTCPAVTVDVICNGGHTWVKVIARNIKALNTDIEDRQEFGSKTIIDQAQEYKHTAEQNPCNFKTPQVVFAFCNGVLPGVVTALEEIGIKVVSAEKIEDVDFEMIQAHHDKNELSVNKSDWLSAPTALKDCMKVNLDITALVALTSNVCNGRCDFVFDDKVLATQAVEECTKPTLPVLQQFMANKELLVCQTALNDFRRILDTIGGPAEKERASSLLKRVTVIDDCPSVLSQQLRPTSHIKPRALTIFGTGDAHQAVTITANSGFVRAASQAGVEFVVFLHPARALTERKEPVAKIISSTDISSPSDETEITEAAEYERQIHCAANVSTSCDSNEKIVQNYCDTETSYSEGCADWNSYYLGRKSNKVF